MKRHGVLLSGGVRREIDVVFQHYAALLASGIDRCIDGDARQPGAQGRFRTKRVQVGKGMQIGFLHYVLRFGIVRHHTPARAERSEEHTSELQSLMRTSYAVFCLKKKKQPTSTPTGQSKRES